MNDLERARYCEAMLYDYEPEWRPEGLIEIDRPDVLAWKRPGRSIGNSRVAYAKWTARDADERIDEILAFFGETAFNWHVGPSSTPKDLTDRLVAHGLTIAERPRLMTADLPLRDDWRPSDARIVEVTDRATMRTWLEIARNDGIERELEERMRYLALPRRRTVYLLAYLDDTAVGNAVCRWSGDGRCLYLTGAGTLEPYRGRGVYQAFVRYRAKMAHARGCEIVSILANRKTSAPILTRRGFQDHGDQPRLTPGTDARVV